MILSLFQPERRELKKDETVSVTDPRTAGVFRTRGANRACFSTVLPKRSDAQVEADSFVGLR